MNEHSGALQLVGAISALAVVAFSVRAVLILLREKRRRGPPDGPGSRRGASPD